MGWGPPSFSKITSIRFLPAKTSPEKAPSLTSSVFGGCPSTLKLTLPVAIGALSRFTLPLTLASEGVLGPVGPQPTTNTASTRITTPQVSRFMEENPARERKLGDRLRSKK